MAVDLTTSPGGLFRRLGRAGGLLNSLVAYLGAGDLSAGGLVSLGVGVDNLQNQFEALRQDLTQGLYALRDSYRTSQGTIPAWLKQHVATVVIEMVNDDTKLTSKTLPLALAELRDQMVTNSASVPKPAVSVAVTAGSSNTGTGVCAASVLGADGVQLDYVPAESIVAKVTADSQGSATAGQEPLTYAGASAQSDPLRWDWPLGSGCSGSTNAIDAAQNNSGNVLQNSSFQTFTTANAPDNWVVAVGTIGTAILQATGSNSYKGSSGLALVGDASVLHSLSQAFNTTPSTTLGAGGTSYKVLPSTVYAVNWWNKVSNNAATGTYTLSLVDGSGAVITDAAGTANTITVVADNLTTAWSNSSGFFRLPAVLPTTVKLRLRFESGTALSAHTCYIDHLAMAPAVQAYAGGPYFRVFSGATEFVTADKFTLAVSNDWATNAKWAVLLERLFNLKSLGIRIPSNGSPTIADSWIA